MRDLFEYAVRCMEYLDDIGIEYGNVLDFSVNTRAKTRWGQCRLVPGGYTININADLLDERNSEEGLMNTILHELLHTCKGCMNHGKNWKYLARKVYLSYGYDIQRTDSADDKGVVVRSAPVKHKFVCEKCGQVITRQRESHFTRNYKLYTCACCHSHFKKVF